MIEIPKLMTAKEIAAIFRVDKSTVCRWIADGTIPKEYVIRPCGSKRGAKVLVDEKAIEALMKPSYEDKELKLYKKSAPSGRDKLIHFF